MSAGGDGELERLMARRLAEMRQNLSQRGQDGGSPEAGRGGAERPKFRDVLAKSLGHRGLEVLQNAEAQFPGEAAAIADKLGRLIAAGEVKETIDGGKLLFLFRTVGLAVRMPTRISVEQDGRMVSLSDKLKGAGGG